MDLELVRPSDEHFAEWKEYCKEFGEIDEEVTPWSCKKDTSDYSEFLQLTRAEETGIGYIPGYVSADTYFLIRKSDKKIIGGINIRHSLNDFLRNFGGHIGYGIRPSERKKGFGTIILQLGLVKAKEVGLSKILISCLKSNEGSRKIIEKNGGEFFEESIYVNGLPFLKYWINI